MNFSISVFVAFAACFYVSLALINPRYEHKQSHDDKFEKPYGQALKSWFNLTVDQWKQQCSVEGKYVMIDVKNLVHLSIQIGRDLSDELATKGFEIPKTEFDKLYESACLLNVVLTDLKVYGAEKLQLCLNEKSRLKKSDTQKLAREIQVGYCNAVKEVAIEKLQGELKKKD